jgi:serine/threonine protein kinase/beta-lactam-binding protein with PASTA domain
VDRTVADPMIGRVLDGRYRVGPRVARGGMATVYEATDLRLDRTVALKVMHAGLGDDDDFVSRFVREARSAARLSHPNVVAVFDQGDDDGTLFLAMEFVDGGTLRDLIRQEAPMPPGRALGLLDPVLAALGAAHQAGLIHRDVKPENVLIADDGRVKVADFGLARAVSAETQHTTAGILIGTVSYLSPELLVDGHADARSDVYAAGVLLYEMLTGRKPHEADSPIQVAYKHVHEDVPPPSLLAPGLPSYVDALVARATARNRDLRPTDARVLLRHVRRVRAALDQGVLEDPDLTSDLSPTVPVQRLRDGDAGGARHDDGTDDIDYVREDPTDVPTVLTPAQAADLGPALRAPASAARADDTSVIGRRSRTEAPTRRRSRRGPVLLVLLLLLATGVAAGGWWFGDGRFTTTPGVVGLDPHAAERKVEAAGLVFTVAGRDWSETVPAGQVLTTDPSGGADVTRHGTVVAVVSKGPERHRVPTVGRLTLDQAQASLQAAHLTFGSASYAWSEKVADGRVLSSVPTRGQPLRRDAAVDLVVSKGPKPVKVPDWTGKDADAARKALTGLRFEVDAGTKRNSDTVDEGDVISQSPAKGRLRPGDTVTLVVSKGPVLVTVPKVVGAGTDDAQAELEAAGFQVQVVHADVYIGLGYVVRQSLPGDRPAPRGSTVVLSVV